MNDPIPGMYAIKNNDEWCIAEPTQNNGTWEWINEKTGDYIADVGTADQEFLLERT